jgi:RNA polymerase sigma-70 factor (ECF subfamily)
MPRPEVAETDEARYRRLARPLWAVMYARCCDAELALDAVQEAFLRWREHAPIDVAEPDAWLLRVAGNWLTDQLRRRRPSFGVEACDGAADRADPAEIVVRNETREQVRAALSGLKLEDREALVLRYALDWSSDRIGDALGLTPAAVDMRLSRARKRLAEKLAEHKVVQDA